MAVDKKRKSVDAAATATKKAKTAPAVEKPAPLKSALKGSKAKVETAAATKVVEKKKDNGTKKEETVVRAKKPANKPAAAVKEVVEEEPASDNDADELTADQTAELLAGFSSSEDEADEEEDHVVRAEHVVRECSAGQQPVQEPGQQLDEPHVADASLPLSGPGPPVEADAEPGEPPVEVVALAEGAILCIFGGDDPGIPATSIAAFEDALTAEAVDHDVVTYPGAPHSFFDRRFEQFADESADAWRRVLAFIRARSAEA